MPELDEADRQVLDDARALLEQVRRNRFAGDSLRGGLPQIPQVDALPDAGVQQAYRFVALRGSPDEVYVCLKDSLGAWGWVLWATG